MPLAAKARAGALHGFLALAGLILSSACSAPSPPPAGPVRGAAGLTALLRPQPLRWSGREARTSVGRAGVLIAASTYASHPEWSLPSAAASADRVAHALVTYCGVAPRAVTQLVGEGVHGDAIVAALARAADSLSGGSAVLFVYYAGHGFVDATGDPLLFGHFTEPQAGGGFRGGLARRDLVRAVSEARARAAARGVSLQVVMIVDACRVGLAAPAPKATLTEAPMWELWSTRPGTYARAGTDNEAFLYTRVLCDAMAALAQTVPASDLRQLADEARARTQRMSAGAQEPELLAPRLNASPPAAILSAGVSFRMTVSDAVSSVRLTQFSVRVGNRTFLAEADGEVLVEALPGVHRLEISAPDYLVRVDELELAVERSGSMLEASVYPALTLVTGRVSPASVLSVRAVGGRLLPRDNYHLVRTVTGRDGTFQLRVPNLADGIELEFVTEDRLLHRMTLPRQPSTSVAVQGGPSVPQVDLTVELVESGVPAIATSAEPGQPVELPRPRHADARGDMERVRDLLRASRHEMARDALAVAEIDASDERLRQDWLHWLELRVARTQSPQAVHKRLLDLAARGVSDTLRLAMAEALLQRLVDTRAWDGVLDLFEVCETRKVVDSPGWQEHERRLLPVALEQVMRLGLADGVQTGDWTRADRVTAWLLSAPHLWVLEVRPALADLRAEVERERVPPACRQAFERADIALTEGRLEDAHTLFLTARGQANGHYRQLIQERLDHLDARVFEEAMQTGTRYEMTGRPTDALWAYAKAYAKDQRAAESLRRVLRREGPRDADFDRSCARLLDETIERAQKAGTTQAWVEVIEFFADAPRAQAALLAALVSPWADVVDDSVGPSGLPRSVRHRRSGIVLRLVEAGSFWMGAADSDREATSVERPRHQVSLTRPFWLGETEVTWEQWRQFAAETGSGGGLEAASARHPVAGLSWFLAERFCAHFELRLPTEAEWECAARAGSSEVYRRYAWGDDPAGAVGNFLGEDEGAAKAGAFPVRDGFVGPAPVATFAANRWGFHDMLGNVREWCADGFDRTAYTARQDGAVDPRVDGTREGTAVVRGGSYQDGPRNAGLATRLEAARDARLPWIGLRVARDVW